MRQKREDRELEIIVRARELIEENGFFSMKMSDLAEHSGLSMGTLYSHFSCKEDLLIVLAIQAAELRYQCLQNEVWGRTPIERFIVSALVCMRFSFENQALCEAALLAKSPSIWKRATAPMHERLRAAERKLGEIFPGAMLQDLAGKSENSLAPSSLESCNIGAWSLSLGMDVISFSSYAHENSPASQHAVWERLFKENLIRFLKGCGWKEKDPWRVVEQLSAVPAT